MEYLLYYGLFFFYFLRKFDRFYGNFPTSSVSKGYLSVEVVRTFFEVTQCIQRGRYL